MFSIIQDCTEDYRRSKWRRRPRLRRIESTMDFWSYRRNLPHWRLENATYFVTWRLARGRRVLSDAERTLVLNAVRHFDGERYAIVAVVVMDDHVHAIVQPHGVYELKDILHSWKSYSAHRIVKLRRDHPPLWQDESFDRIVRDQQELDEKVNYIWNNPFKRWPELEDYEWVWWPGKDGSSR